MIAKILVDNEEHGVAESLTDTTTSSWEAAAIFTRDEERFHHLGVAEVAIEGIQLVQPEAVSCEVCVRSDIGIAPQVSEILHQHKRLIELLVRQGRVLCYTPQRPAAGGEVCRGGRRTELVNSCRSIVCRWSHS